MLSVAEWSNQQKHFPDGGRKVSHFGSQSGQAVLEYLLILIVVVGIALGVLYQLNSALKQYVQSYFGDYVACLLEAGELPSLGGGGGVNSDSCNSAYEEFSLRNGRPLIAGNGSNSSSDTPQRSQRNTSGSRVTRNNSSLNAERNNTNSTVAGSVSRSGKRDLSVGGSSDSGASGARARKQRSAGQVRLSLKGKIEKEKTIAKTIDLKGNLSGRSQKKIPIDMDKFKRKPAQSDLELGLSFGDYVRYLIILGILVLIIIFFGGQLLQLKKSWESN